MNADLPDYDISSDAMKAFNEGKTDNLYARKTTDKEGRTVYKVDVTSCKPLRSLVQSVKMCIKGGEYFYKNEQITSIIKNARNEKRQVTPENLAPSAVKLKFQKAVEKAKVIGKDLTAITAKGYKGVTLNEHYWAEALYAPHGNSKEDFATWKQSYTKLSFEEWQKSNDRQAPQCYKDVDIDYLKPNDLAKLRVSFLKGNTNNAVLIKDGKPLLGDTSPLIFAIDKNEKFYCKEPEFYKFHHSSFLAGGAVIGVGAIHTDTDGHIDFISNRSGHYLPDLANTLEMLKYFEKQGVDLTRVEFQFFDDKEMSKNYSAKAFLDNNGPYPLE